MLILGIESTCDETGIALVRDGRTLLSHVVASQEALHQPYGGVIPELACRYHLDVLDSLLKKALVVPLEKVDLIAVAQGPGLIGALWIGIQFAQGLAFGLGKPLLGINHIEAHLYAATMGAPPPFPALGLVVSGGHTALVYVKEIGCYTLIGQTQDDAIGEAFDKAAKLLGLPYPGGPHLERLAQGGDPRRFPLRAGRVKKSPFDFSFSGLKTAFLYLVQGRETGLPLTSERDRKDAAASFQRAAFSDLVEKAKRALAHYPCKSLLLGGGVSQNQTLRHLLAEQLPLPLFCPPEGLSADNGAMIAGLAYPQFLRHGVPTEGITAQTRPPWTSLPEEHADESK